DLYISDRENLRNRISQFSSHIAMQYMLDLLFSCIFKVDYDENIRYIEEIMNTIDDREIDYED
ncbi:MurR/RpiR family transcriptional regulator, partial [Acinetobacter baumannii]